MISIIHLPCQWFNFFALFYVNSYVLCHYFWLFSFCYSFIHEPINYPNVRSSVRYVMRYESIFMLIQGNYKTLYYFADELLNDDSEQDWSLLLEKRPLSET